MFLKILKSILKNFLVFIVSAIAGVIFTWAFLIRHLIESAVPKDNPIGMVIGVIILYVFYSILAFIISGILGIIIYNIFKIIRKKR